MAWSLCIQRRGRRRGDRARHPAGAREAVRTRTPRDPRKLEALAALWLRAERIGELVVAGADRRPVSEWRLLRDLCGEERSPRLTMMVEDAPGDRRVAALGSDVLELTFAELARGDAGCRDPFGRLPSGARMTLGLSAGA